MNWVQGRIKDVAKRRIFQVAISAYRSYQWVHSPRNFDDQRYYSFECGGFPFFVTDGRTQRVRDDDDQVLEDNHMLGYPARDSAPGYKGQIDLLCEWLIAQQKERGNVPKFIVSASVFVPNDISTVDAKKWRTTHGPPFPPRGGNCFRPSSMVTSKTSFSSAATSIARTSPLLPFKMPTVPHFRCVRIPLLPLRSIGPGPSRMAAPWATFTTRRLWCASGPRGRRRRRTTASKLMTTLLCITSRRIFSRTTILRRSTLNRSGLSPELSIGKANLLIATNSVSASRHYEFGGNQLLQTLPAESAKTVHF